METSIISQPCIFTSADSVFFNTYGISFINSFRHFNPTVDIHFHIIDPLSKDILILKSLSCNYSVSYTDENLKLQTVENLKNVLTNNTDATLVAGLKSAFRFLTDMPTLDKKLYKLVYGQNYRSGRFIALNKLWDGQNIILCYDVDTLCSAPISINDILPTYSQGCLDIKGKFVTSLTAFKDNSQLVRDWGNTLEMYMQHDKISFGFMDQNTFIKLSNSYSVERIDRYYCNHSKKGDACVITGKGQTKFGDVFLEKVKVWKT
jgi:hypothetical protein